MIFSASRRTDIPAFYGEWFMNRLRAGELAVRNPVNPRQVSKFLFDPESIDCIVFWTKNPAPFLRHLPEIDSLGYRYYFQFTLTPYGNDIERNIDKSKITDTFIELSDRIGRERVIWRYDPIIINEKYSIPFHGEHFDSLAEKLHGYTEKCVISFVDRYSFLKTRFNDLHIDELTEGQMEETARKICESAEKYSPKLQIAACCEKIDLGKYDIQHNRCIDGELIARITGAGCRGRDGPGLPGERGKTYRKDPSQRGECGCAVSRDIGAYNTCFHDCVYCYAGRGKKTGVPHDPLAQILGPG